jgi:Protein of unknown function (DUF3501)
MKLVDRGEILGLAEYEAVRERFRARVIAEKKLRRVQLGPRATAVFENHDTMLMQVQEMLRTERITRPAAVQHEIDTYNEIVPGRDELSCTVMIEIVDKAERDAFLRAALGFEKHVWLVVDDEHLLARAIDRGAPQDRTTAVHYLKFALPRSAAPLVRAAAATELVLEVDHPAYAARAVLSAQTAASLAEDLRD